MRKKQIITKQQKIDTLKHQRNNAQKLALKEADYIRRLVNRTKIDYFAIYVASKEYQKHYLKWLDYASKIKLEEDNIGA